MGSGPDWLHGARRGSSGHGGGGSPGPATAVGGLTVKGRPRAWRRPVRDVHGPISEERRSNPTCDPTRALGSAARAGPPLHALCGDGFPVVGLVGLIKERESVVNGLGLGGPLSPTGDALHTIPPRGRPLSPSRARWRVGREGFRLDHSGEVRVPRRPSRRTASEPWSNPPEGSSPLRSGVRQGAAELSRS